MPGFEGRAMQLPMLSIPVVFHIIHNGNEGKLERSVLERQIDVLNEAFAGTLDEQGTDSNLRFTLHDVTETDNIAWFNSCKSGSYVFRPKLNRDSKTYVNVYTCSGDGYLGWTWLPWTHDEGNELQALVINENAFPKGADGKYNLGYTLVHEMGHYFGLLHTFQKGGTCTKDNDDGVDDTPYEKSPGSSCTTYGRDTCPDHQGTDPLWSFMDYSYDRCMLRFSPGQVQRMRNMMAVHRPSLVRNSFAGEWSPDANAALPVVPEPTRQPTRRPTATLRPTSFPTNRPSPPPTNRPTWPTRYPTQQPTQYPVYNPVPTPRPTPFPTPFPTKRPTRRPTWQLTPPPAADPTKRPTMRLPTPRPSSFMRQATVGFAVLPTDLVIDGSAQSFQVTLDYDVGDAEPTSMVVQVGLHTNTNLHLASSEFETCGSTSVGRVTVDVVFQGTPLPGGCFIKAYLVSSANVQKYYSWHMHAAASAQVRGLSIQSEIASTIPPTTPAGTAVGTAVPGATAEFTGCGLALNWDQCLNAEPFKSTGCDWTGTPRKCTSTSASASTAVADKSTSTCDIIIRAEQRPNWFMANTIPTVCAGSRGPDRQCYGLDDHYGAAEACKASGARLCTAHELNMQVAAKTGCGYNTKYTWSSTPCDGGFMISMPRQSEEFPQLCVPGDMSSANTYKVYTRCCADAVAAPATGPAEAAPAEAAPAAATEAPIAVVECADALQPSQCGVYYSLNFCESDQWTAYMRQNCMKTCGMCPGDVVTEASTPASSTAANPAPSASPPATQTQPTTGECKIDLFKKCDRKGCCMDGLVCALKGKKMKCRLDRKALGGKKVEDGGFCEKNKDCKSKFCDRKALYSNKKRRCVTKPVSGASTGADRPDDENKSQADPLLVGGISAAVAIIGVVLVSLIVLSHLKKRQDYALSMNSSEIDTMTVGGARLEQGSAIEGTDAASSYRYGANQPTEASETQDGTNTFDVMSELVGSDCPAGGAVNDSSSETSDPAEALVVTNALPSSSRSRLVTRRTTDGVMAIQTTIH